MRLAAPRRYIDGPMKYRLKPWRLFLPMSLSALVLLGGCSPPNAGTGDDSAGELLSSAWFSINDDTNLFYAGVSVTLATGATLDTIWTEMYLASGALADSLGTDSLLASVALNDSATGGDILLADGVYAATFASPFAPGTGGSVRFEIHALVSRDTTTLTDTLALENLKPVILSVTAADTLALLAIDTLNAEVADPDGLADIRSVNFTLVRPDSTVSNSGDPTPLMDNGDEIGWGDMAKDDGIYSYILRISSTAQIGTYTFRIIAKDFAFNISDTTFRTLVVTP